MKFIIKLSPEITIKSQSVRIRFIKILASSIRNILQQRRLSVAVIRYWDRIEVRCKESAHLDRVRDELRSIPGIHHILLVEESHFESLHDIFEQVLTLYQQQLADKSFCVRAKRKGQHDFTSLDIERYVGGGLNQHIPSARVKLTHPDVQINLQIEQNQLLLVKERIEGLNGFPIGTQEDVLSLISGGFDSSVASYMLLRRGCRVHYCFFNLGGPAHEIGVKQMAWYLWQRFASSHRVRFIAVDFTPVVAEILEKIEDGQMGVILKRMMVRAASQLAQRYGIQALITGEALGQVSSQTLTNLRQIDSVSDTLIIRPLIAYDKEKIISLARQLGTEELASTMPEFCGVISKSPTVKAVAEKLLAEEEKFDFSLLDSVVRKAEKLDIREIAERAQQQIRAVETVDALLQGEIILDIRAPEEQEDNPLEVAGTTVLPLPFYRLQSQFAGLDQSKTYLLYCRRGVMSRLQALYLQEIGFYNIKVYLP